MAEEVTVPSRSGDPGDLLVAARRPPVGTLPWSPETDPESLAEREDKATSFGGPPAHAQAESPAQGWRSWQPRRCARERVTGVAVRPALIAERRPSMPCCARQATVSRFRGDRKAMCGQQIWGGAHRVLRGPRLAVHDPKAISQGSLWGWLSSWIILIGKRKKENPFTDLPALLAYRLSGKPATSGRGPHAHFRDSTQHLQNNTQLPVGNAASK